MPLQRLRGSRFSKRKQDAANQHAHPAHTPATLVSERSSTSWSSTHKNFTRLRFFVWTGGDPGFTLTTADGSYDGAATFACDEDAELRVDRVTALKVWEAGVHPGDILETVGGKRVHTMDTEAAIVLVQMSKSPSIIRFRSLTSGKRVRFDVLLGRKTLGLSFTGDSNVLVATRVSSSEERSTPSCSGVQLGDMLVAVNGMDAVAAGIGSTLEYLDTCPRPLRLTFERSTNDGNGEGWLCRQAASEESGQLRRGSLSLLNAAAIPSIPGRATRASARLRCGEFLRSLMPVGVHSAQLQPQLEVDRTDSHFPETRNFDGKRGDVFIEWERGPLGLTLLEDAISGAPVVNRLTGKGSSASIACLQHGFELHSINGVRTEGRNLEAVCQDLSRLPKPVRLIFRPPHADDTSEEDNNFERDSRSSALSLSPRLSSACEAALETNDHQAHAGNLPQSSLTRNPHEYDVLWTSKRLGLELEIANTGACRAAMKNNIESVTQRRYPIVHKVLKESSLGLPSDAVGHLFISVNNWSTCGLSTVELRTLLQVAARPAVLRFRKLAVPVGLQRTFLSESSCGGNRATIFGSTYSILWTEGELGITFGCYTDADHQSALVVFVKHIGPGQAKNTGLVAVGDLLRTINGKELPPKQKFKKTVRALTKMKRPVTLGFRRLMVEQCSEDVGA
jgi:hypothetical protein